MNALVRIEKDRVVADSRDVASQFGKRHDHVLRAIDVMVKDAPELGPNFGVMFYPVQTANGATRNARRFDMNRKGFMLLVMGFSGARALEVKSRWIDAFDAMERTLTLQALSDNDDADLDISGTGAGGLLDYTPALAVIREARQVFGRGAAQRLWSKLGLPEVTDHPTAPGNLPLALVPETIRDWMGQCTRVNPLGREESMKLFSSYMAWCDDLRVRPETLTRFGRTMERMGFHKKKSDRVQRVGIELITA